MVILVKIYIIDPMQTLDFILPETLDATRLDQALTRLCSDLSRTRVQALIAEGQVHVNDTVITSAATRVYTGDRCLIQIPPLRPTDIQENDRISLDVVFEDEHMLVINKQPGLTVHPGAGNHDDTLVNALLAHCGDSLSGIGGEERPGIVHRLDKDTSGLMVVAKHDVAHRGLAQQIERRTLKRTYHALCWGMLHPTQGMLSGNIARSSHNRKKMTVVSTGGKEAVTHYRTLTIFVQGHISLVECTLETGRTHQIRVHLSQHHHSILGDPLYGSARRKIIKQLPEPVIQAVDALDRQMLHAVSIAFTHPVTNTPYQFTRPAPDDMQHVLSLLEA